MEASIHLLPLLVGLFLIFSPPAGPCDSRDKAALLNIKAAFSNSGEFSSWTNDTNCCGWKGVSCNQLLGRVEVLSFDNKGGPLEGLSGPLPDALGDLPFLISLLFRNHPGIVGPLPSALTRLRLLGFLTLRQTSLSGSIPPFLSQIRYLKLLDLSFNKFSGDVPVEFGAADLMTVDLSHNKLSGGANALFGANKTLRSLDLSFNMFEFDLSPINFPANLTKLILNDNKITGSIPVQINQLTSLVEFNISNNQLCGVIPAGPVTDKFDDTHFIGNKCLCRSQDSCS
ncbi:Polygalacturonase inhibitor [Platanthera zijinensis]|uniref:Polygalacturonase inhibitor n=1 Tax=Platanthera zijinensis TaxID=2320716 RepID=A0AAP0AXT4_9ASPA